MNSTDELRAESNCRYKMSVHDIYSDIEASLGFIHTQKLTHMQPIGTFALNHSLAFMTHASEVAGQDGWSDDRFDVVHPLVCSFALDCFGLSSLGIVHCLHYRQAAVCSH